MTAASRSLKFGTIVKVIDAVTGKSVTVRVNDFGPASWVHRDIDLSQGAATKLGIIGRGVACVHLEIQVQAKR